MLILLHQCVYPLITMIWIVSYNTPVITSILVNSTYRMAQSMKFALSRHRLVEHATVPLSWNSSGNAVGWHNVVEPKYQIWFVPGSPWNSHYLPSNIHGLVEDAHNAVFVYALVFPFRYKKQKWLYHVVFSQVTSMLYHR
jgi:hypothetical protein